jgi:hypothetical protein
MSLSPLISSLLLSLGDSMVVQCHFNFIFTQEFSSVLSREDQAVHFSSDYSFGCLLHLQLFLKLTFGLDIWFDFIHSNSPTETSWRRFHRENAGDHRNMLVSTLFLLCDSCNLVGCNDMIAHKFSHAGSKDCLGSAWRRALPSDIRSLISSSIDMVSASTS